MTVVWPRSRGHLSFAGAFEFYERGGEVYRAAQDAPVMPDGFRAGRWECTRAAWDRFGTMLEIQAVAGEPEPSADVDFNPGGGRGV